MGLLFKELWMLRRNRRDTPEPNGNLEYQMLKVGFKGKAHMFGLIFNPKIKQKNNFLCTSGSIPIFLIDAVNSFLKNASITHFKFVETRPRETNLYKKRS